MQIKDCSVRINVLVPQIHFFLYTLNPKIINRKKTLITGCILVWRIYRKLAFNDVTIVRRVHIFELKLVPLRNLLALRQLVCRTIKSCRLLLQKNQLNYNSIKHKLFDRVSFRTIVIAEIPVPVRRIKHK